MKDHNYIEELKNIVQPYLPEDVSVDKVTVNSHFIDELNINSANLVDIVLDVEDAYDIVLENDDIEKMLTVNDVMKIIESKKKE
ncbi:MAG: acyl carrier protein [Eudoraea sp.]